MPAPVGAPLPTGQTVLLDVQMPGMGEAIERLEFGEAAAILGSRQEAQST